MYSLKQTRSVTTYTTDFQQIAERLEQDEHALVSRYYIGLKDFIKDKISERKDDPKGLEGLIELATKIDSRAQERKMEKSYSTRYSSKRFTSKGNNNRTY